MLQYFRLTTNLAGSTGYLVLALLDAICLGHKLQDEAPDL